jgi:hypothetical protein
VSGRAGALAEIALRDRHRSAWPRNAYAYDLDELRRIEDRKLILEVPRGVICIAAEYKAVDEGPLDLNDLQYQTIADATHDDLGAFCVQFTHPRLDPPQPWAFRLWPLNDTARHTGAVEFTEAAYCQYLYIAQANTRPHPAYDSAGTTGIGVGTVGIEPWDQLADLDYEHPDPSVWPSVTPARPHTLRRRPLRRSSITRFVEVRGRRLDTAPAGVTRLTTARDDRPALGAVRAARAGRASTRVPVALVPAAADDHERALEQAAARGRRAAELACRGMVTEIGFDPTSGGRDVWRDKYQ